MQKCPDVFSYTFQLRSLFINIFFSGLVPHATFPLHRHDGISPTSDNLSCVFRVGLGIRPFLPVTRWACRAPHPSPPKGKPEARSHVNRNLGGFPAGRKKSYPWTAFFLPVGKPELRDSESGQISGLNRTVKFLIRRSTGA